VSWFTDGVSEYLCAGMPDGLWRPAKVYSIVLWHPRNG